MKTTATVLSVEKDRAIVKVARASACQGCHHVRDSGECSACTLLGGDRSAIATAENLIGAGIGDTVTIETSSTRILFYAAIVFLAPLVATIFGFGIVKLLTESDTLGTIGAAVGFAGNFLALFFYSKRLRKARCDVRITEIIPQSNTQ